MVNYRYEIIILYIITNHLRIIIEVLSVLEHRTALKRKAEEDLYVRPSKYKYVRKFKKLIPKN